MVRKERKRRRILYTRWKCLLKTVQKRTKIKMANKFLEKRISAAKEELKTITKKKRLPGYKSKYLHLQASLESEFS